MKLIGHTHDFSTGTRVIMLTGRNKDGAHDQRKVMRVTHGPESYNKALQELVGLSRDNERIYVTANARSLEKASRIFKERQLESEYDAQPMRFYSNIETRWVSCLMQGRCSIDPMWLWDIDSRLELEYFTRNIKKVEEEFNRQLIVYSYKSKNGWHYFTKPFNRSRLPDNCRTLCHDNPLALIGY